MTSRGYEAKDRLVIGNTLAEMTKVIEFVEKFGAAHGIPQAAINDLNLCLDELLNNTISYGYDGQTAQDCNRLDACRRPVCTENLIRR